jgi:hypothetical protein
LGAWWEKSDWRFILKFEASLPLGELNSIWTEESGRSQGFSTSPFTSTRKVGGCMQVMVEEFSFKIGCTSVECEILWEPTWRWLHSLNFKEERSPRRCKFTYMQMYWKPELDHQGIFSKEDHRGNLGTPVFADWRFEEEPARETRRYSLRSRHRRKSRRL